MVERVASSAVILVYMFIRYFSSDITSLLVELIFIGKDAWKRRSTGGQAQLSVEAHFLTAVIQTVAEPEKTIDLSASVW